MINRYNGAIVAYSIYLKVSYDFFKGFISMKKILCTDRHHRYVSVFVVLFIFAIPMNVFSEQGFNTKRFIDMPMLEHSCIKHHLKKHVLYKALQAYEWAVSHHKLGLNNQILTVVDFSLPSNKRRLWVIDLSNDKILLDLYTTHGKGSGGIMASHFSNKPGSHTSSLGLYTTSVQYYGDHGYSMRLIGLQPGINSLAWRRDIVVHGAWYATPTFIHKYHRAGRSWGCFAVAPSKLHQLINDTKGGSAWFAYA